MSESGDGVGSAQKAERRAARQIDDEMREQAAANHQAFEQAIQEWKQPHDDEPQAPPSPG